MQGLFQWRTAVCAILVAIVVPIGAAYAQVRIAVVGDSNVAGRGVASPDAYPAKLERALRARGIEASVLNSGVNGDTTDRVLARLDDAAPQGTQIAVVWVGVNDARRGIAETSINANRQLIASRLKAHGIEVVNLPRTISQGLHFNPQTALLPDHHLSPAGYDQVVARTLPQIIAAIRRVKRPH